MSVPDAASVPQPDPPLHRQGNDVTTIRVDDSPKMLRETLCLAQSALNQWAELGRDVSRVPQHVGRLERLIAECDRMRPLGPDGKHGNRHTPECGCEDL